MLENDTPGAVFVTAENPLNGTLSLVETTSSGFEYQFAPAYQFAGTASFEYLISWDGSPPYERGLAGMARIARILTALLIVACSPQPPVGIHNADSAVVDVDPDELSLNVDAADLIFVGRLIRADYNWFPLAGSIAVTRAEATFGVVRVLKGEESARELPVLTVMHGEGPYLQGSARGVRLAPGFFVKGDEYVLLVRKESYDRSEPPRYHVVGTPEMGIWKAGKENVGALEAVLSIRRRT